MNKKYVIEIMNTTQRVMQIGADKGKVSTYTLATNDLEELNSDYINEHYGELQDEAYQRGLDDAWECARKLFSTMADSDIEKAFPIEWNNGGFNALINLQPQEAIEKLKAYEEKQKADDGIDEKITGFLERNNYTVDEVFNRLKRMKGEE